MIRAAPLALVALALVAAHPAANRQARGAKPAPPPTLLAVCNDIKGKIFGVSPRRGWDNDRLPASVSFVRGPGDRVDILSADRSIAEPGLAIRLTHHSADFSFFILTGTYRQARVDTWAVTFEPGGAGRLIWTALSTHMPPTDTTQGALYTATCTR